MDLKYVYELVETYRTHFSPLILDQYWWTLSKWNVLVYIPCGGNWAASEFERAAHVPLDRAGPRRPRQTCQRSPKATGRRQRSTEDREKALKGLDLIPANFLHENLSTQGTLFSHLCTTPVSHGSGGFSNSMNNHATDLKICTHVDIIEKTT